MKNDDFTLMQLQQKFVEQKTSHLLHLVLTIATVGFWSIIWIMVALSHHMERARLTKIMNGMVTGSTAHAKQTDLDKYAAG